MLFRSNLSRLVAQTYVESRAKLGYPMCTPEQLQKLGVTLDAANAEAQA